MKRDPGNNTGPEADGRVFRKEGAPSERQNPYKLYHVLNHLSLFGGCYLRQAEYMIESYSK